MKAYKTSQNELHVSLTLNPAVYFFRKTTYSELIGFEEKTKAYMFSPSVINVLILVMGKTPVWVYSEITKLLYACPSPSSCLTNYENYVYMYVRGIQWYLLTHWGMVSLGNEACWILNMQVFALDSCSIREELFQIDKQWQQPKQSIRL